MKKIEYASGVSVSTPVTAQLKSMIQHRVLPAGLIVFTAALGGFRPAARFHYRTRTQAGVLQPVLTLDPVDSGNSDGPLGSQVSTALHDGAPVWTDSSPLVLKNRRVAFVAVAVRRLKLPPASEEYPLPS